MKLKTPDTTIALNRKASHDYQLEDRYEAGIVLEGWEVKSLRSGHVQLRDGYVFIRKGEPWLIGVHITPLSTASTHIHPDPDRTRKLLLHQKEIRTLIGKIEQKGYTVVPLSMYWKQGHVKCSIALARGKKQYDKRETEKRRTWQREKERMMKHKF